MVTGNSKGKGRSHKPKWLKESVNQNWNFQYRGLQFNLFKDGCSLFRGTYQGKGHVMYTTEAYMYLVTCAKRNVHVMHVKPCN